MIQNFVFYQALQVTLKFTKVWDPLPYICLLEYALHIDSKHPEIC